MQPNCVERAPQLAQMSTFFPDSIKIIEPDDDDRLSLVVAVAPSRTRRRPPPLPPNIVESTRLALDQVRARETAIAAVFEHWQASRRAGCDLPLRRDFNPLENPALFRPVLGWMHRIDVTPDDPEQYTFGLYGSSVAIFRKYDFSRVALSDIPCPLFRGHVTSAYQEVKELRVPRYAALQTRLFGYACGYTRLVLPLSDDGRTASQLLVVVNKRA